MQKRTAPGQLTSDKSSQFSTLPDALLTFLANGLRLATRRITNGEYQRITFLGSSGERSHAIPRRENDSLISVSEGGSVSL